METLRRRDVTGTIQSLRIPDPLSELKPGLKWGRNDVLFTPSFWKTQCWLEGSQQSQLPQTLGDTLEEEVVACILGGHGMPAELGIAAFQRLKQFGLFEKDATIEESIICKLLCEPLTVNGKKRKYRFAPTKARYVHAGLSILRHPKSRVPSDYRTLRTWLLQIPGVGPKTASWIVRNRIPGARVAIIDVHILHAGWITGFFPKSWMPQKHYDRLEERFLAFADALDVSPGVLDAVIWDRLRQSLVHKKRLLPRG